MAVLLMMSGCGREIVDPPIDVEPDYHDVLFSGDLQVAGGQAVGVVGRLDGLQRVALQYQWEQIQGPEVVIANARSSVLAFDMPLTESVAFRLTITGQNGESVSGELSLVPEGRYQGAYVRRDHEVVEGNAVSLRLGRDHALAYLMDADPALSEEDAHLALDEMDRDISWQQLIGPTVVMDTEDPERALFSAPWVTGDTPLVFEVVETLGGTSYSDLVYVDVTEEPRIASNASSIYPIVHAYRPGSPWRDGLESCVYSQTLASEGICARSRLNLLGEDSELPTIDEIMDRVLVSHDWMGARFEEFLRERDTFGDMRVLMRSVSAIVIAYDVRPSHYNAYTAGMYIDPAYLWITKEERDTLNEAPDYRSAFGQDLQFLIPWRYVKDDDYVYNYTRPSRRADRTWDDYGYNVTRLLYHELAHAADLFPPRTFDAMEGETYADVVNSRVYNVISNDLQNMFPLTSGEMYGLAEVRYRGEDADLIQAGYLPEDVAGFFEPDRATMFYSYVSPLEDLAMTFEEAMMGYRYGMSMDVAITDSPPDATGSTIMVSWGQRGRIGSEHMAERAAFTIEEIMPELDGAAIVENFPEPTPMRVGESWIDNLTLSSARLDEQRPPMMRPLHLDLGLGGQGHLDGHIHQ